MVGWSRVAVLVGWVMALAPRSALVESILPRSSLPCSAIHTSPHTSSFVNQCILACLVHVAPELHLVVDSLVAQLCTVHTFRELARANNVRGT